VRERNTEDGGDSIADELLHDPAVPLDRHPHLVEVPQHERADGFGIESLAHLGGTSDVAKEHRRQLAAFP
jgi:hypothetical protein